MSAESAGPVILVLATHGLPGGIPVDGGTVVGPTMFGA